MTTTATDIDYYDGTSRLSGVLMRDDTGSAAKPAVIVFHEAWGINAYILRRTRMIAELGYIAFAADIFGERKIMSGPAEAMPITAAYRAQPERLRARALAALEAVRAQPGVDPKHIGAMGYCFGGTAALELARAAADVAAVVSFHGTLASAAPVAQPGTIKGSVLACIGADDPVIPATQVAGFQDEMTRARADFHILVLGGAVHSFTNPGADALQMPGVAYNEKADRRSWAAMRQLFEETFA